MVCSEDPGLGVPLGLNGAITASATSGWPMAMPTELRQIETEDARRGQASQLKLPHPGKMLPPFPFALWLCSKPRSQHVRWDQLRAARFHKGRSVGFAAGQPHAACGEDSWATRPPHLILALQCVA